MASAAALACRDKPIPVVFTVLGLIFHASVIPHCPDITERALPCAWHAGRVTADLEPEKARLILTTRQIVFYLRWNLTGSAAPRLSADTARRQGNCAVNMAGSFQGMTLWYLATNLPDIACDNNNYNQLIRLTLINPPCEPLQQDG